MSSPAEPKRRRLDDDLPFSAGVSFPAQDVSENASSTSKTEPATGGDADEDVDLHAQLKVAVERRKEAQTGLKTLSSKELEAKNWLDHQISYEMRELKREHDEEQRELKRKHDEELRQLYTRQKADRGNLDAKNESDRAEHDRIWVHKFEGCNTKLEKRKAAEMTIRSEIRERGQTEADSLLAVGTDGIAAVLPFLTVLELGRCEITCRAFKMLLQDPAPWSQIEKYQPVTNRSSASDARSRIIRYHIASKFAERLESLVEKHSTGHFNRCRACSAFPSKLLIDPSPAKYELFVRFSKETRSGRNRILVLEGFVDYRLYNVPRPFSKYYPSQLTFNLDTFDLSSWPSMERVFRQNAGENTNGWMNGAKDALLGLTATIVAVERSTSKTHLVVGSADFDHETEDDNGKITIYATDDMAENPHRPGYLDFEYSYCLAFKWDDERNAERKFECHVIQIE